MRSGELSITEARDDDGAPVLVLVGELDSYRAPRLKDVIDDVLGPGDTDAGPNALTLDLAGITFIDSSGISVLVLAHKRLAERGGQLAVHSPQRIVHRVLEVTGLTQVFRFD